MSDKKLNSNSWGVGVGVKTSVSLCYPTLIFFKYRFLMRVFLAAEKAQAGTAALSWKEKEHQ